VKSKAQMSSILEIFTKSTMQAFSKQFAIEVFPVKSFKTDDMNFVCGYVEINCNKFNGQIRIHIENGCLVSMYNSIFDEKFDHLDNENADFSGEVMNILYCLAKDNLSSQKGFELGPEIPKVEKSLKVFDHSYKSYFESNFGHFFIELFEENWATQLTG